jgi:hypothetical protein
VSKPACVVAVGKSVRLDQTRQAQGAPSPTVSHAQIKSAISKGAPRCRQSQFSMNLRKKARRCPLTIREVGINNTYREGRVTSVTYDTLRPANLFGYNTVGIGEGAISCEGAIALRRDPTKLKDSCDHNNCD